MNIKAIATDLDGTLLSKKTFISKSNVLSLSEFIDKGGIVTFLTGRCYASTIKFVNKFEKITNKKIGYISCLKGAYTFNSIEKKVLDEKTITSDLAKSIFDICIKNNCAFSAYLKKDLNTKRMIIYGANTIIKFLKFFRIFSHYECIKQWNIDSDVFKINISGVNLKKLRWNKNLKNCLLELQEKLSDKIDISLTSNYLYEINAKNCNKGSSIKIISNDSNISLNEFAAFGDSENDIDMFKIVGMPISICSKNSNIDKYAKYNIKGLQLNAVSKGINKYILLKK